VPKEANSDKSSVWDDLSLKVGERAYADLADLIYLNTEVDSK
jgi:hypothetical protein